jgi:hypothetical protein
LSEGGKSDGQSVYLRRAYLPHVDREVASEYWKERRTSWIEGASMETERE